MSGCNLPVLRSRRRHWLAALAAGFVAAVNLATLIPSAHAQSASTPGIPSKFTAVSNIYWNGMRVSLWHVPGYGIYAYKIDYLSGSAGLTAPSTGWQYCQNPAGYSESIEQCTGIRPPVAGQPGHPG
jgi:hypothetical protein